MTSGFDIERLGRQLQERLGLALTVSEEVIDGGRFSTLRPSDLERGNGFAVVLSRTPRQVVASFRADNFAAALIRKMWEADDQARGTFQALLSQARGQEAHVYLAVDGEASEALPQTLEPWRRVEIDVSGRMSKVTADSLLQSALFVASTCMSLVLVLLPVEAIGEPGSDEMQSLPEGARMRVEVNRYERSPANRAACIAYYGAVCQACGFSFKPFYGKLGEGYIEVHHRVPVSRLGGNYFVNPVADLVPVCANCHAMVHRADPPMAVEALKHLLASLKANPDVT